MATATEEIVEQAKLDNLTIYEQRRWYCCFSWHKPALHNTWLTGSTKEEVPKGKHPSTRAYRKALSMRQDAPREWDWSILVNEHTDQDGWQYARCGWVRFDFMRVGAFGRSDERRLDFVRRRQWVHKDHAAQLQMSAKRGALQLLTPAQMAEARQEAQRKWDEGMAEVWRLLAQLDETTDIKSLASALLDPVALQKVARLHRKAMKELKAKELSEQDPQHLPSREQWNQGLVGTVVGLTGLAHDGPARRLGRKLKDGLQDLVEHSKDMANNMADNLVHRVLQRQGSLPRQASMPRHAGQEQRQGGKSGTHSSGLGGSPVKITAASGLAAESARAASIAATASTHNGAVTTASDVSPVRGSSTMAPVLPTPFASPAQRPSIARLSLGPHKPSAVPVALGHKVMGQQAGTGTGPHVQSRPKGAPAVAAGATAQIQLALARSASLPMSAGRGLERQHEARGMRSALKQGSRRFATAVDHVAKALHIAPKAGGEERPVAGSMLPVPRRMVLSCAELECAMGHALGIYGDIETYVGAYPMQSYYAAIEKFSHVPEQDILLAVWRSQTFEPAHYVAIDRERRKIVICVRGTMELVDGLTDVVGRPEPVAFGPGLDGCAHAGILRAARFIVSSVRGALAEAVSKEPGFNILVTGHSLGGGTAALVAMMLRHDPALPAPMRQKLRGVTLAPAAVADAQLAAACQDFVAAVVYNTDIVPRVDVYSAAKFVHQVAHASPLKRTLLALYRALGLSGPKKGVKQPASAAPTEPAGPAADVEGQVEVEMAMAAAEKANVAVATADAAAGAETAGKEAAAGGLFSGLAAHSLAAFSSGNAEELLLQEPALRAALRDLEAVAAGSGSSSSGHGHEAAGARGAETEATSAADAAGSGENAGSVGKAGASTRAGSMDVMTAGEVALAGASNEGRTAAGEVAHAVRQALVSISRYRQVTGRGQESAATQPHATTTSADGAAAAGAPGAAGPAPGGTSQGHFAAAELAITPAGGPADSQEAAQQPDKQAARQELVTQVSAATAALQSFMASVHSRAKAAVRPQAAATAVAAAYAMSQADSPTGSIHGGPASRDGRAAQQSSAAGPVAEASEPVAKGAEVESGTGGQAAAPQNMHKQPSGAQSGTAATGTPPATRTSSAGGATTAAGGATSAAAPAQGGSTNGTAAEMLKGPDNLLHPLLPAGTLYWLLPDTRASTLINKQIGKVMHRPFTVTRRSEAGATPAPGDGGMPGANAAASPALTPADSSGAAAAGGSEAGGEPGTSAAPADGSSDKTTVHVDSSNSATAVPEPPAGLPPAMKQKGDTHMERTRATLGGFFGDLQDGLEAGERLAGDSSPHDRGEAVVLPEDGEQLVLLQVEACVFQEMLFFKQALADHVPLAYLKAIRRYLAQERARPVWEKLGSMRL